MNSTNALRFSNLSPLVRVMWAKSGAGSGHGVLAHLLDVAAVTETLLEREPASTRQWAGKQFGLQEQALLRWIAAIAGLHDFGKAIPGFQHKWPEGRQADSVQGLSFPHASLKVDRHDLATNALLGRSLQNTCGAMGKWLAHVIQAVSAHHGYHFLHSEWNGYKPDGEPSEWSQARDALLAVYWQVLAPQGQPAHNELSTPAVNWLAGLTSTADWIASNTDWFPLGERKDDLQAYYQDARHLAKNALQSIGWEKAKPLLRATSSTGELLAGITGRKDLIAHPLQVAGDRLLLGANGPSLLLVEAPMGEGKTELAFLAHLRLQAVNGHRGLYVALPTQATGNAMFKRTLRFIDAFAQGHASVQLVHGGAKMNDDVPHLRGIDGIDNSQENLSASAWFSQRRRPLLAPYGVGTVDQILYATLNVKHHFVRLWGLANRVVVLDEVHAYDAYTNGLIVVLLRWLKALGCSVVLMSATLPNARRDELLRAWGLTQAAIPVRAYPRVLLVDDKGISGEHISARKSSFVHLSGLAEGIDALAEKALELLTEGGCGVVIVNTVNRAQQLYLKLRENQGQDVQLLLFHARYPTDERTAREQQVLAKFGPDGERPGRALLVATQVVEQSLDLDFDFMLTDLAPVDLLLQRAGRLHRHSRSRPDAHTEARLWVAGLQGGHLPDTKATAWSYVYDDYILLRTWALLKRESVLQLPIDIDRLVQAVYADAPLPAELEAMIEGFAQIEADSYGAYLGKVQNQRRSAAGIAIDPNAEPQQAYANKPRGNEEGEGIGLENKTRLGLESVTLIPVEVTDNGWCVQAGEVPFSPDLPLESQRVRQLYNRQIQVSNVRIVKHFKVREQPVSIRETAALKNARALPLRNGRYDVEGLHLRLDDQLGLVIESGPNAEEGGK